MRTHWPLFLSALVMLSSCCPLSSLLGMETLEAGSTAPPFELPDLAGHTVSLADFAGLPVLLAFWKPT